MNQNQDFLKKTIRVGKEDSAFVYCLLEAREGITSYSTLPHQPSDAYRDLELQVSPDFEDELNELLSQLGEMVYEFKSNSGQ